MLIKSKSNPPQLMGHLDKDYDVFTDGSRRLRKPKVKGKAAVKAAKRARQR